MSRSSGKITAQTVESFNLNKGYAFTVSHIATAFADDADFYFLIKCGDRAIDLGYQTNVGGDCYGRIYESPTTSSDGTPLSIIANNRSNILTDGCTFFHTPSVSDDGTLMAEALIAGGSGKFSRVGGSSGLERWKLNPNTNYLIKITNKSGGAIDISHTFNFTCAGH